MAARSFPPGTLDRACNKAIAQAGAAVVDEDFIGPAFAEPIDGRPGLVFAVFPTSDRLPGGANLCLPAKVLIRIALTDSEKVHIARIKPGLIPGKLHDGTLGSFSDDPPSSIDAYLNDNADWTSALEDAGDAIALRANVPQKDTLRRLYDRFPWKMLQPTYQAIAPVFLRWMKG